MSLTSRSGALTGEVLSILEEISGHEISVEETQAPFMELGLDSLILTQVALALSRKFGVAIKLRHLVEDYPSSSMLVEYLDSVVDPTKFPNIEPPRSPAATPSLEPEASARPNNEGVNQTVTTDPGGLTLAMMTQQVQASLSVASNDALENLVQQQLSLMAAQLELLGAAPRASLQNVSGAQSPSLLVQKAPDPPRPDIQTQKPRISPAKASAKPEDPESEREAKPHRHGPQLVIRKGKASAQSPRQEAHLDALIERYVSKLSKSKEFTARNRSTIADPRTVSGFHSRLKEGVFPIVAQRSAGCRIWDLDGNEYIDLLSGYGSNFFGFGAPFIRAAIAAQMEVGMEIGPQSVLVEEVTRLFLEFVPHFDRVAYCNTGSEAVLATFRLARTVVGRDLIVMFEGGYHGMFDEVVVRPTPKRSMPAAPGIPRSAVEGVLVLPWNDPQSLDIIRKRADEIAGVIVEPVQSRAPHIQPAEFLKNLRDLTKEIGAALIFDEVVCGFRVAKGGGQEYFGIQADLASYGKVVGGGISIGIVGGKREFMDALDGGGWQYGDDSTPTVGVTYFAGTFVRYPLALAAAKAALTYMKQEGPGLQERVSAVTQAFAAELNAFFAQQNAPLRVEHFSSFMKIALTEDIPWGEIFFYHLRELGVHVWEGRPAFLTMMHGEEEIAQVIDAFKEATFRMQKGGYFPEKADVDEIQAFVVPPIAGAKLGRDPDGSPAWFVADPKRPGQYLRCEA